MKNKQNQIIPTEKITEITAAYDAGVKVADIISKYNLDIHPSQLSRLLPPIETEHECPYCGIKMKRPRKREIYINPMQIRCEQCGHSMERRCECSNCESIKEKENAIKKKIIFDYYREEIPAEKLKYTNLVLEERYYLYLLYVLESKYRDLATIKKNPMRKKTANMLLAKLQEMKIIYVSPLSDVYAFDDKDFPAISYPDSVDYMVNVEFSKEEEEAISRRNFIFENIEIEEIKDFLYKLVYDDLLDYFGEELAKRKIRFVPTEKQLKEFQLLLTKLSYTQIKFLCLKVVKYYSDELAKKTLYRSKVPGQVLASVNNFYQNNMRNGWAIHRADPEYAGFLLKYFVVDILGEDIMILDRVL